MSHLLLTSANADSSHSAIKLAKTILRSNRTSHLLLWDGYARLEIARNKIEAARGVYVTALTLGEESGEDKIQLWRSWAEMELNGGRENLALKVIVEAAGVGTSKDLGERFQLIFLPRSIVRERY